MQSRGKYRKNHFYVIIVLLCLSRADAGIVALSLPSLNGPCTGTFGGPGTGRTVNADFGIEFLSIDEVRIHLVGSYAVGTGHDHDGRSGDVFGTLTASMSGWATLPRILPSVQTQFDYNLLFYPFANPEKDWGVLMDGREVVTVQLGMINRYDVIDRRPTINITFAELIVEGSPVPEPSMLSLLTAGMIILRRKH